MGNGVTQCEWRHEPEARGGFLEILKKSVSWNETCLGKRRLAFACSQRPWAGVARDWGGGRWKSQNRKIVPPSPYVEKCLNSKVIKSFVPEQRSRKCFSCFEIPMFYVIYIWTFDVRFTHSHIMAMAQVYHWNITKQSTIQTCKPDICILPTPPLRAEWSTRTLLKLSKKQVRIQSFDFPLLIVLANLRTQSALLFTNCWRENRCICAFPKDIREK